MPGAATSGTFVRSHYGQHDPDKCYACKLATLTFNDGTPKTHVHNGDPWDGNPVKERIEELTAAGRKIAAMELHNPNAPENADAHL